MIPTVNAWDAHALVDDRTASMDDRIGSMDDKFRLCLSSMSKALKVRRICAIRCTMDDKF